MIIINNNNGGSQAHNLPRQHASMYFIDYRHEKTKEENQCCLTYLIK